MGRLKISCKCGWVFFLPGHYGGSEAKCPSCGQMVLVKGSTFRPRSNGRIATRMTGVIGIAAILLVVAGAYVVLRPSFRSGTDDKRSEDSSRPADRDGGDAGDKKETRKEPADDPDRRKDGSPVQNPRDPIDYHVAVDLAVYKMNASGIVCELMRHSGNKEMVGELCTRMGRYDEEIRQCLEQIGARGESHQINDYFRVGDRIVHFEGKDLRDDYPHVSAEILMDLVGRIQPDAFIQFQVVRRGERRMMMLYWKWIPPEIKEIFSLARIDVTRVETKKPETSSKLPVDLLETVKKKTISIPAYYFLILTKAERERLDTLLKSVDGTPEDIEFLRTRILKEFAAAVDKEVQFLEEQLEKAKGPAFTVARPDVVFLKNGTKKEGKILEESAEQIRLEVKIGNGKAVVTYKTEEVDRVERDQGQGNQFAERLKTAGEDATGLQKVIEWCVQNKLKEQGDYVSWVLLRKDPSHAIARRMLGFAQDSEGLWIREEALAVREGRVQYEGRWFTIPDLEQRLASQGHAKLEDGLWYSKARWNWGIDSLYGDLKKVQISFSNTEIADLTELRMETVYDAPTKKYVQKQKRMLLGVRGIVALGSMPLNENPGRFGSRAGSVQIIVVAPGNIVKCSVRAPAQVTKSGASVAVRVRTDAGKELNLYRLTGVGSNSDVHDVTATVQGGRTFYLEAELNSAWEEEVNGYAQFLPCSKRDQGLLRVTGEFLAPMEALNKAIAKAKK